MSLQLRTGFESLLNFEKDTFLRMKQNKLNDVIRIRIRLELD